MVHYSSSLVGMFLNRSFDCNSWKESIIKFRKKKYRDEGKIFVFTVPDYELIQRVVLVNTRAAERGMVYMLLLLCNSFVCGPCACLSLHIAVTNVLRTFFCDYVCKPYSQPFLFYDSVENSQIAIVLA